MGTKTFFHGYMSVTMAAGYSIKRRFTRNTLLRVSYRSHGFRLFSVAHDGDAEIAELTESKKAIVSTKERSFILQIELRGISIARCLASCFFESSSLNSPLLE